MKSEICFKTFQQQKWRGKINEKRLAVSFFFFFFFCLFAFSGAAPAAHGGSQTRGQIGAVAAVLSQSHSNVGSEPCLLRPTPELTATPDP